MINKKLLIKVDYIAIFYDIDKFIYIKKVDKGEIKYDIYNNSYYNVLIKER